MAKRRKRRKGRRGRRGSKFPTALVALIVLGALLVGGFFAWIATRPETGEEQQAACVLVIDRTGSSDDDVTVDRYRQLANRSITGCREQQARMSIYYFDQATQKLVLVDGTTFDLWLPKGRKDSQQNSELDETIESAQEAAASVFDSTTGDSRGSDILTAVNAAAENLSNQASADGVDERYLIVLTDGIQLSSDVTVETFSDESVEVSTLVDRARDVGLIPERLEGAQVSFVGVRSGAAETGDQLPEWFEEKVESFWRTIIGEGGGSMCTYVVDSQVLPVSC